MRMPVARPGWGVGQTPVIRQTPAVRQTPIARQTPSSGRGREYLVARADPPAGRRQHYESERLPLGLGMLERRMVKAQGMWELVWIGDQLLLNRWFGVGKGKYLSLGLAHHSGAEILRIIMNLTVSNTLIIPMTGDIRTLPYPGQWRAIILQGKEVLVWSFTDLKGCFYLLLLPPGWSK